MTVLAVLVAATFSALGAWLARGVWIALRTGMANVHNEMVKRLARPWYYWTAVIVQTGFAAACFFVVARGVFR